MTGASWGSLSRSVPVRSVRCVETKCSIPILWRLIWTDTQYGRSSHVQQNVSALIGECSACIIRLRHSVDGHANWSRLPWVAIAISYTTGQPVSISRCVSFIPGTPFQIPQIRHPDFQIRTHTFLQTRHTAGTRQIRQMSRQGSARNLSQA